MLLQTQVIGNLGKDAIVREVNGKYAINFSIAHNEKFTKSIPDKETGEMVDHEIEKTTWINCTIWRKNPTKLVQYLTKGSIVHVSGRPKVSIFRNNEGVPSVDFSLDVQDITLISSTKSKEENSQKQEKSTKSPQKAQEQPAESAQNADEAPY